MAALIYNAEIVAKSIRTKYGGGEEPAEAPKSLADAMDERTSEMSENKMEAAPIVLGMAAVGALLMILLIAAGRSQD